MGAYSRLAGCEIERFGQAGPLGLHGKEMLDRKGYMKSNPSGCRAGARGGALVDRPRCLRILTMVGGSSMEAKILRLPWQWGHV